MNRAEFITEIAARADDESFHVAKRNEVGRWVNLAVRSAWKEWPWTFATDTDTVTTTADDALVSLPVGCQRPKRVVSPDAGLVLKPQTELVLQQLYAVGETGPPEAYCDGGLDHSDPEAAPVRRMRLYPIPDASYDLNITFIKQAPSLSLDTHVSPLPEEFDEAIIDWCLVRYYRKLEDLQQANEHLNAYRDEISNLIGEFSVWQVDRFPSIPFDNDW